MNKDELLKQLVVEAYPLYPSIKGKSKKHQCTAEEKKLLEYMQNYGLRLVEIVKHVRELEEAEVAAMSAKRVCLHHLAYLPRCKE